MSGQLENAEMSWVSRGKAETLSSQAEVRDEVLHASSGQVETLSLAEQTARPGWGSGQRTMETLK